MVRFAACVAVALACAARAEPLQLYSGLAPPVSYISQQDHQPKGMAVEMMHELIKCTGDSAVISAHPWSRVLKLLDEHPLSGMFVADRTPEREAHFQWVGPIYRSSFNFYALKSAKLKVRNFTELTQAGTIAVPAGWQAVKRAREQGLTDLLLVNDTSQLLPMLKQRRVKIIGSDELMLRSMGYQDHQLERLVKFSPINGYLAFNPQVPSQLVKRWQSCFGQMRRSGSYQRIYLNWIGQMPEA